MKDETLRQSSLAGLRSAAFVVLVMGAVGSVGLLRHAQQHPPPILVVLFVIWVCAPFTVLGVANLLSKRWPRPVRATLYILTMFLAVMSLAIYLDDNIAHRTAKPAFVYVAVPPATVVVSMIAVGTAALMTRKSES